MSFEYSNLASQIKEKFSEEQCIKIRGNNESLLELAKMFNTSINVIKWIKSNPEEDLKKTLVLRASNFTKKLENYDNLSVEQLQELLYKFDDISDFLKQTEAF